MYSRGLSALAFTADFPPAAPKFHQRTHRVRLRNLGTTDKKSSHKIKHRKTPRVHTTGKEVSVAFAETFKALSDPVRRRILELLKNGRLSAGEIGSHFDMTGATISYHLGILKKADLVLESREKNFIYYELNTSVLEEIMLWISELKGGTSDVEKI